MALPTHFPAPLAATPLGQLLQSLRNKVPISIAEEQLLRGAFQERRVAKNEHLFRAGEVCPHNAYIVRGVFRYYQTDAEGTEHTTRLAFDDYFIGDPQSLFEQQPSGYSVQCLEAAVVLTLDKAGYDHLFAHCPPFNELFRIIRNRSFSVTMQQLMEKSTKSAEQRYRDLLREHPRIFQRVALKIIASWMGITPETLSRIRKNTMPKLLS